jgi:hypothetical protein
MRTLLGAGSPSARWTHVREIGLSDGRVRYAWSALAPAPGFRGLFDLQTVDERSRAGPDEYPRDLFEAHWAQVG